MNFKIITIAMCFISTNSFADTIEDAFNLCEVFDSTGVLSQECEVDAGDRSVKITLDMSSSEARKFCSPAIDLIKQNGMEFGFPWKLKMYSPYSNDKTIAICRLD